ncbi:MAG: M28 family peptidase [Bdellovibrionaceae bacterium]|nr:M28 family peptidase [Pseudobdellovibrionaceae bacterium]
MFIKSAAAAILVLSSFANAHFNATGSQTVLTNLSSAKAVGGVILSQDALTDVAVVHLNPEQLNKLSAYGHSVGRCAGFEVLDTKETASAGIVLNQLRQTQMDQMVLSPMMSSERQIVFNVAYKSIIDQADANNLRTTIAWLSSYPDRYNKSSNPNIHVNDLKTKLNEWLKDAPWKYTIETIAHTSTKQNSLKLTIPGTTRPNEVVVLGGHLDSINQGLFGIVTPGSKAPGADDNASGSSNLIEALKLLKQVPSFERTLEFYWYAGEESGLLGSAEIAKAYKAANKNVIGVLQLDMTLFPGDGEQVVGLMTDFTSPWLRSVLTQINDIYVKGRFVESQCGYGCSDHASWNRQGYHAVIPFEATMNKMNSNIHSAKDVIDSKSSMNHSNTFTKYATLFALVLGNSLIQAP